MTLVKNTIFETKKKDFPPFSEILKTGRYFMRSELMYLKPHFQNNSAITLEGFNTGKSVPFDFGYDAGSRFHAGFESKYGPGAQLNYFQYDHQSRPSSFTQRWADQWRIQYLDDGAPVAGVVCELRTRAKHYKPNMGVEVQNLGMTFYKDWKLPVARLGGGFGFQYVSIAQDLQATVTDASGTVIGRLSGSHDFRALGPKFEINYYRPVGHTKLEMLGGLSGVQCCLAIGISL